MPITTAITDVNFGSHDKTHTSSMTPSPPLADSMQVVQISSLAAALATLNIGIPVEDVIQAVHREDEAKRATLSTQATQRRAALSKRNSTSEPLHPF
jgi:hypothetical protein